LPSKPDRWHVSEWCPLEMAALFPGSKVKEIDETTADPWTPFNGDWY
jgi:hypothetical protein